MKGKGENRKVFALDDTLKKFGDPDNSMYSHFYKSFGVSRAIGIFGSELIKWHDITQ